MLSAVWLRPTDTNAATSKAGRLPGIPPTDCQKHAAHAGTCDGAAEDQESVSVAGSQLHVLSWRPKEWAGGGRVREVKERMA